jgi:hypothetical protein
MRMNLDVAGWAMGVILSCAAIAPAASLLVTGTVDGGGQRATNATITLDCSIGGIGGVSTAGTVTAKSGYIGQLSETTNLTLTADVNPVNEGGSSQLGGLAFQDDATVTVLVGSNIIWSTPVLPAIGITLAGQINLTNVYADTSLVVTGSYLGVIGAGTLLVLDSNPDNYGTYAGDGILDGWQVKYFGINNPFALAGVTNVTGMNNLNTYIADLNPTNPASRLKIATISNQIPNRVVYFTPASSNRVYALQYSTNLVTGVWTNVTPVTNWGNGGTCWLTDTNLSSRFYRIMVQLP